MKVQKIIVTSLCVAALGLSPLSEAKSKDGSVQEVILVYGNDANSFKKVKLHLTPYSPYISFESFENQEYVLDCPNSENGKGWVCFSPCGGGSIKISFSKATGFKNIKVDPFRIQPRLCDGSESEDDPYLTSRSPLVFQLKEIQPSL